MNSFKKRICILLSVFLLFTPANIVMVYADNQVITNGNNNNVIFVDIGTEYDWARDAIESFARKGIVSGVGDNKFEPEELVTREQFAKMLVLTYNAPLTMPAEATFSDVPKDKWSYPYIEVSKDFLTGYINPFGGKPAFHPEDAATREDIAVSLVKIMGLSPKDLKNSNYVDRKFKDADEISNSLRAYVGIAAERGLINGYSDRTFRPQKSITRAEAVVLLNRVTKQAISSMNEELYITANIINGKKSEEVTLSIKAEEGTSVTVDGQSVRMDKSSDGYDAGMCYYKFNGEGQKVFKIEASKASKRKSFEVIAEYKVGTPILNISSCPETASSKTVKISGTVKDSSDKYPKVFINEEEASVDWNGNWAKQVQLKEGTNVITIKAVNGQCRITIITKTIYFNVGVPELTISSCPGTTNTKVITVQGYVKDNNDSKPKVYINDEEVNVDWNGFWSKSLTVKDASITLNIRATNNLGKSTIITRIVFFDARIPDLNIDCPEISDVNEVTISGTVKDINDLKPRIFVNDQEVYTDWNGKWEKSVTLNDGINNITIKVINSLGKTESVTKTVIFNPANPQLTITTSETTVNQNAITLYGTALDKNDKNLTVTASVYNVTTKANIDYNGYWNVRVNLVEGNNTIVIKAVNKYGKYTITERNIKYIKPKE